ncbi:leukocyte-associated immunoglobulin-like receptor 1 [Grammomys surdaster]|uniref:leukocyte-associated immunoglobulin-like receptor 1 n=1 Tax=Grammomys surdaster TaxID=491861 RepID=UPI0010A02E85|nr:leukocyte-associated immunoglobulin-like receptor 1 [Grammomys surdaster]
MHTESGGSLPDVTICAEPGPVIFQGSFVTVVCSKSGDYDTVRLEKDGSIFMEKDSEPSMREDRFHIGPVNKTITGHYHCFYRKGNTWSNRSEKLELKVIKEHVTQVPAPGPTMTSGTVIKVYTLEISVRMGVAGLVLLILLVILTEACCNHEEHHRLKCQNTVNR